MKCIIRDTFLSRFQPMIANIFQILSRIVIGYVFIESGYGKLTHLEKVIEFFASIGIPLPQVQAPFAAGTELICGVMIVIGLATRLAAIPLILVMAVAIKTAKWKDIEDVSSFLSLSEFLFIVLLIGLVAFGAGCLSIDSAIKDKFCNKK